MCNEAACAKKIFVPCSGPHDRAAILVKLHEHMEVDDLMELPAPSTYVALCKKLVPGYNIWY